MSNRIREWRQSKVEARQRAAEQQTELQAPQQLTPGIELRDEFQYSDTRTLRRGDLFRVSGGPTLPDGRQVGDRGTFRFDSAWCQGKRWYVLCTEVDRDVIDTKTGRVAINATKALFVAGAPYPNAATPIITMRPYRLHRMLDETARKAGLQGMTRSAAAGTRAPRAAAGQAVHA